MTRALLDVSVLVAMTDPDHMSFDVAHDWFGDHASSGWASCAITQNGAVRILSQPGYSNPVQTAEAVAQIAASCASPTHEFWPCDVSVLDDRLVDRRRLLGPNQITDSYLLALAVEHGGRFVTFDHAITVDAVAGARDEHLVRL